MYNSLQNRFIFCVKLNTCYDFDEKPKLVKGIQQIHIQIKRTHPVAKCRSALLGLRFATFCNCALDKCSNLLGRDYFHKYS